jgi:hypothetical protein
MKAKSLRGLPSLGLAALVLLPGGRALADVIDGDWCYRDGRYMSIHGPEIVTPAGTRMTGSYSRHSFTYVIPPSEPGAGQTVYMILVNEETVNLRIGADAAGASRAPVQVWHRCAPQTSALEATPGDG